MKSTKLKLTLILAVFFILGFSSHAKETLVTGKITAFDKYPLNKVSIIIKGTTTEVLSDSNGRFEIECNENDKLLIRAKGFTTEKVRINKIKEITPLNVNLNLRDGEENLQLAVDFGHLSEETLTQAIEIVKPKLDYGSYDQVADILSEKCNLVNTKSTGGLNATNISIAGMKGAPLLIVDGFEVQSSYFLSIPTTDIESIKVLRNTASARYGTKGFSGVIELTTKSN
ncbi:TonB-dependent receptor plug domain-containing protein [Draconibacterium sp.]|nr:TonB-dependent receptor plug domain-containing protein [Draconibacterium sp.]